MIDRGRLLAMAASAPAMAAFPQLASYSPVIHGAKLWNGYMYNCDDAGTMFRFRMPA